MRRGMFCLSLMAVLAFGFEGVQAAGLTSAHRKDLNEMKKDLGKVERLLRQKKGEEAETIIKEAEAKWKEVLDDAGIKEDDKSVSQYHTELQKQKKALMKHKIDTGEITPVSFLKDVAPVLNQRCGNCHGNNNPRAKLQLNTFAGMEKGGQSGPLLTIGEPDKSLILARIKSTGDDKMPQNGAALSPKDIEAISTWILQGAKFDGKDKTAPFAAIAGPRANKPAEKIVVAKPTGNETVSFVKDVAPFMVNICMRCHSGNDPRGGLSMETFEKMMQGGNSGRVIIPGNLDGSRMWDLAGKQDPIKMPPGQLLITRKNHTALKVWIEEGAKFDGDDPKTPLRRLVPTDEELKQMELAKLSHEDLSKKHLDRANEIWKLVLNKEEPKLVEGKEFIVIGNVGEGRLEQVQKWATEDAKQLRTLFADKEEHLWKGKLTIFVMKDRFSYEEFAQTINRRQPPKEVTGHSVVSSTWEDVYVCVQDIGDAVTSESGGLQLTLMDHMTGAFLQRSGGKLPDWVLRGTGLAVASRIDPNSDYLRGLRNQVPGLLNALDQPENVFADGQFSPGSIGAVGLTVVDFLFKAGGGPKFGQFVKAVQGGTAVPEALKNTYGTDTRSLAQQYGSSLSIVKKKK